MSVLDVGTRCASCSLVDFLPFLCPGCSQTFCRDHVQRHACASSSNQQGDVGPSRKRVRATCAFDTCGEETIESIGGREDGVEGENIAREVRCVCGGAFCVSHRSQEAHECPAPRALSARNDAAVERREKAKEMLSKHFPAQAAKERVVMPKQVDKTRSGSPPKLPSASSQPAPSTSSTAAPSTTTPVPSTSPADTAGTKIPTAEDKLYKVHVTKIRSLARPLDAKVARDVSSAVEFVIDESGQRVRSFLSSGKYAPTAAAAALGSGGGKPERLWVPHTMPGGKLFDTLVARSKLPRAGTPLTVLVVPLRPGPRVAGLLDLTREVGQQVNTGDVLVLVRGGNEVGTSRR